MLKSNNFAKINKSENSLIHPHKIKCHYMCDIYQNNVEIHVDQCYLTSYNKPVTHAHIHTGSRSRAHQHS